MKFYKIVILLIVVISHTSFKSIAQEQVEIENKSLVGEIMNSIIGSEVWDMDTIGSETSPLDRFGEALSRGDYNDDGYQDLAIGIPNYDFLEGTNGVIPNTGTVLILYGSPNGLSFAGRRFLFQTFQTEPPNIINSNGPEANDQFGRSLASGDFNCDGITDLAVGTPNEDVTLVGDGGVPRLNVGAINIFYGSNTGFAVAGQGSTFLLQGVFSTGAFSDSISAGDRFGWALASGNFNGDFENGNRCIDLAVSAPFEDFGNLPISDAGVVHVYYGSSSGISGDNRDTLAQNTFNADDDIESNDQFGLSLVAGGFRGPFGLNGITFSDLAIGIPGEDVDGETNAGAVQVFNGGSGGLVARLAIANDDVIWSQSGAIGGVPEANDRFGSTLTRGNFNADPYTDLVVGVIREDVGGVSDAGAINVIYGGPGGLTTTGNQLFTQGNDGILGIAEVADQFGQTLTSGFLNDDIFPDLVVGVPRENTAKGAFHVIYGGANGLTSVDNIYEIDTFGENIDEMSFSMVVADFGNGRELAVGIPGDNSSDGDNDSGSVEVFSFNPNTPLPEVIFKDGFDQ